MKVIALALGRRHTTWLKEFDRRMSEAKIRTCALLDFPQHGNHQPNYESLERVFALDEIPALRNFLMGFDYVFVAHEGYLAEEDFTNLDFLVCMDVYPSAMCLSLRPTQAVTSRSQAAAIGITTVGERNWVCCEFKNLALNDYPRFPTLAAFYRPKTLIELCLKDRDDLSGIDEIEGQGAKVIRSMPAFSVVAAIDSKEGEYSFEPPPEIKQTVTTLEVPKVSIVVPTKNRPETLRRTIQSIINQTFQSFEILVVNDGGQPLPQDVLNMDPRIRYQRHETSLGPAAARNTGIRIARGEYLAYIDDDDIFWPRHFELMVAFIEEQDADLVFSEAARAWLDHEGAVIKRDMLYPEDYSPDELLLRNYIPTLCILHRRSLTVQAGVFDEKLTRVEDWDLWIRFSQIAKVKKFNSVTCEYSYLPEGASITSAGFAPFWWHEFLVRAKHRELYKRDPAAEERLQEFTKRDVGQLVYELCEQLKRNSTNVERVLGISKLSSFDEQIRSLRAAYPEHEEWWTSVDSMVKFQNPAKATLEKYRRELTIATLDERVSIVVPLYNAVEYTRMMFQSLLKHTPEGRYEVIFVDNASSDGTAQFLDEVETHPAVKVIRNKVNRNFSGACNQGAQVASFDLVLFLNNDIILTPHWFEPLVLALRDPSVGVAGNKQLIPDKDIVHHAGVVVLGRAEAHHYLAGVEKEDHRINRKRDFSVVTGSCLLIRRWLFNFVGGFDELYVNGMEDCDLCLKIRQLDFRITYVPESCVWHYVSQSPGRKDKDRQNAAKFVQRWAAYLPSDLDEYERSDALLMDDYYKEKDGVRLGFILHDDWSTAIASILEAWFCMLSEKLPRQQKFDPRFVVVGKAVRLRQRFENQWWCRSRAHESLEETAERIGRERGIDCWIDLAINPSALPQRRRVSSIPYAIDRLLPPIYLNPLSRMGGSTDEPIFYPGFGLVMVLFVSDVAAVTEDDIRALSNSSKNIFLLIISHTVPTLNATMKVKKMTDFMPAGSRIEALGEQDSVGRVTVALREAHLAICHQSLDFAWTMIFSWLAGMVDVKTCQLTPQGPSPLQLFNSCPKDRLDQWITPVINAMLGEISERLRTAQIDSVVTRSLNSADLQRQAHGLHGLGGSSRPPHSLS